MIEITPTSHFRKHWLIDPAIVFLNHGSFGACPRIVLQKQAYLRSQLENEPLRFFMRDWEPLLDQSRVCLASFVGADPEDVVFVPNATTGINAVLRSLDINTGDELLTTNHEYNASRNALDYVAQRYGAKVVVVDVPFPIQEKQQVITAVMDGVSDKTRLVLIDHVTSQTGLIFPIQELTQQLGSQGIETLVDGAHAPGMIPLKLRELGATYYTGNCHKWLCAPKGAGFLYVQRDRQAKIRPLSISHGANSSRTDKSRFQLEFDWTGTDDPTPYMCVPEAISLMGSWFQGGWDELMQHNHNLVITARKLISDAFSHQVLAPESMLGSMAAIPVPDGLQVWNYLDLHDVLLDKFGIEVQIVPWQFPPGLLVRVSAQIYNSINDYHKLIAALQEISK